MTEKLEELKRRAENLIYKDEKELDDIKRKAKLYFEKLFPNKLSYHDEVDKITFSPSYWIDGMGSQPYIDSWSKGKQELVNLLDTGIIEAKLSTSKPNSINWTKSLLQRINYSTLVPIVISLISGAFFLGMYFGENKFDQQKIDLIFENKELLRKQDSLILKFKKSQLDTLNKIK